MNNCVLKLNVNGTWISLGEQSPEVDSTVDDIIKLLASNQDIRKQIEVAASKKISLAVEAEDLNESIVPNTNIGTVLEEMNLTSDDLDLTTPILAVKRLVKNGVNYYGKRILTTNGKSTKEVFVINISDNSQLKSLKSLLLLRYKLLHPEEFPFILLLLEKYKYVLDALPNLQAEIAKDDEFLEGSEDIVAEYKEAMLNHDTYVQENSELKALYKDLQAKVKLANAQYDADHYTEYNEYLAKKTLLKTETESDKKKELRASISKYESDRKAAVKLTIENLTEIETKYKEYEKREQELRPKLDLIDKYQKVQLLRSKPKANFEVGLLELLEDYLFNKDAYYGYKIDEKHLSNILDKIIQEIRTSRMVKDKYNGLSDILQMAIEGKGATLYLSVRKFKNTIEDIISYLNGIENLTDEQKQLLQICNEAIEKNLLDIKKKPSSWNSLKYQDYLIQKSLEVKDLFEVLINNSENDLYIKIADVDNIFNSKRTTILLAPNILNVEERYGWTFETIRDFSKEDPFKGFNVYRGLEANGKVFYTYSLNVLTPYSYCLKYSSLEEVQTAIRKKLEAEPFYNSANIELLFANGVESKVGNFPKYYTKGLLLETVNFTFDSEVIKNLRTNSLTNLIYLFLTKGLYSYSQVISTLMQELKFSNSEEFATKVAAPLNLAIFLYLLGKNSLSTGFNLETFTKTLAEFDPNTYKKNTYYVDSSIKIFNIKYTKAVRSMENGNLKVQETPMMGYQTMLYKIDPIQFLDGRQTTPVDKFPTYGTFKMLADKVKTKLNVDTEILSASQIKELFGDKYAKTKAFIRDGKVYINISLASLLDYFHEYTHLLLGSLKAVNYDNYIKLIQAVADTNDGKYKYNELKESYPELAEMDLLEEVFAELYSKYLMVRDNGNLELTLDRFTKKLIGYNEVDEVSIASSEKNIETYTTKLNELDLSNPKAEALKKLYESLIEQAQVNIAEKKWRQTIFSESEGTAFGDLLNRKLGYILSRFSRDFSGYMQSTSEFSIPKEAADYRKASNIISALMQKYNSQKDSELENDKINEGIKEECK